MLLAWVQMVMLLMRKRTVSGGASPKGITISEGLILLCTSTTAPLNTNINQAQHFTSTLSLYFSYKSVQTPLSRGGPHSTADSILVSRPAAPGLILDITNFLKALMLPSFSDSPLLR